MKIYRQEINNMLFGSNLFSGGRVFATLLLVFSLYGCGQTREECKLEAAKAPTELALFALVSDRLTW